MNHSDEKSAEIVLAALAVGRPFAYVWLNSDLIVNSSGNWENLFDEPCLEGNSIISVLPELVGAEEDLKTVLGGEMDAFTLTKVNREQTDGSIRYFNFQLTAVTPENGLLLIVEDSTQEGQLQQAFEQAKNELRLARRKVF